MQIPRADSSISGASVPVLMAQTEAEIPGQFFVTRMEDGQLSCGRATPEEMTTMRAMRARMVPARTLSGRSALRAPVGDILVHYTGFTPEAQAAFQRAVDIWSSLLITSVPIEIEADFESFEDSGTLAFVRPVTLFTRESEFWEPVALANQLVGRDLDPEDPDIKATFSSSANWYFGLDGDPPINRQDFVSVVLHEIGHGLGVFDSFAVDEDGNARYGVKAADSDEIFPTVFDLSIRDSDFLRLFNAFSTPSPDQAFEAITGIKLFWGGPKTRAANGGRSPILLWAPEEYDSGSSVAHLDEDAYPSGTPNALMTPRRSRGEVSQEPGPLVLAMLSDMGWTIRDPVLQIPQFGVGGGLSSDVVVTNRSSTEPAAVAIDIWSPDGGELDGNLILGIGADRFDLPPLGSRTLTLSYDGSGLLTGSVTVSSDTPVSAVVRFDLEGTGITGVGSSPGLRSAIAPVRRSGNLSTGIAVRNVEVAAQTVELTLKDESGEVVTNGTASKLIESQGRIAQFIHEIFPEAEHHRFQRRNLYSGPGREGRSGGLGTGVWLGVYDASGEPSYRPVGVVEDPIPAFLDRAAF